MAIEPPILYAEDDENDVYFMKRAWSQREIQNPIYVVGNGELAIDYLSGIGHFSDRIQFPLPCLILLDLKMPLQSGLDVLKWVRSVPQIAAIPVVILSSSNLEGDLIQAAALGVNDYLIKPGTPSELAAIVESIKLRWLNQVTLSDPSSK